MARPSDIHLGVQSDEEKTNYGKTYSASMAHGGIIAASRVPAEHRP